MSIMTQIRTTHDELATVVQDEKRSGRERAVRSAWSDIGPSIIAIAVSVLVMAGLMALRLWFLMPGAFHLAG